MKILDLLQPYEISIDKGDYISVLSNSSQEKSDFANAVYKNLNTGCGIVFRDVEKNFEGQENYQNQKCENLISSKLQNLKLSESEVELRVIESLSVTGLSEKSLCYVNDLSAADKQKLAFANMLSLFPETMILESPFNSLSQNERDSIFQIIDEWNKKGNTVIFSTENFVECFRAKKIIVLEKNKIIFNGSRDEFLLRNDLIKNLDCCKN